MKSERNCTTLQQISQALGVPESVFYKPSSERVDPTFLEASQALELLKLFSEIKDPVVRLACLKYVRNRADEMPSTSD